MSVTILPRELGAILRCNGTAADDEDDNCNASLRTGQIQAGLIRHYAATIGWGRGFRKGRKRRDQCPSCMPVEKQAHQKQQADWQAEQTRREEMRKAKREAAAQSPKPKRSRKRSADSSDAPSAPATPSPSADSAPAPAT